MQCKVVATARSLAAICKPTLNQHTHRDGDRHVRGIWDRLHPAQYYAEEIGMLVTHAEHQNSTLHARPTTKTCTALFADRNQCQGVMPPNPLHRSVSYPTRSRETREISPGPIANGLTRCRPPALQQLQQKHTPRQKCTPAEDLASSTPPPEKMMCAHARRGRAQTQAQAKRRIC